MFIKTIATNSSDDGVSMDLECYVETLINLKQICTIEVLQIEDQTYLKIQLCTGRYIDISPNGVSGILNNIPVICSSFVGSF